MRYVTRTIKMANVEYEYLDTDTKEVHRALFQCRYDNNENKIRKALVKYLEKENKVYVSIVDIQKKKHHFEMEEEKYIAEAHLASITDCE